MISIDQGEVTFEDGLRLRPHAPAGEWTSFALSSRLLPVHGWMQHHLGIHPSDKGRFDVEVSTGADERVEAIFLSHMHPFYEEDTPEDNERRVFHEGVIAADLNGQREFAWGQVLCRLNCELNRDFLVVVYTAHKRDRNESLTSESFRSPLD